MLILVVKASDFRQKLSKGLWCCSNSSSSPCSTGSAIRHFPAVSCGRLLDNSTKISIHEASYTSLLVCSLLCSHHKFGSRNSNFQWFKNFLFCDGMHVCVHVEVCMYAHMLDITMRSHVFVCIWVIYHYTLTTNTCKWIWNFRNNLLMFNCFCSLLESFWNCLSVLFLSNFWPFSCRRTNFYCNFEKYIYSIATGNF